MHERVLVTRLQFETPVHATNEGKDHRAVGDQGAHHSGRHDRIRPESHQPAGDERDQSEDTEQDCKQGHFEEVSLRSPYPTDAVHDG